MRKKRSRVIIFCVLFSILCSVVSLNQQDNSVLASNYINEESLSTQVNKSSNKTNAGVVINEVMFFPGEGEFEWVELKNISNNAVDITGWSITDEDDNWYEIPDELPSVPASAFVVIIFDGKGDTSNDYDFGDNSAILHSQAGLVNIFEDEFDQVALYINTFSVYLPLVNAISFQQPRIIQTRSNPVYRNGKFIAAFVAWGADPEEDGRNAFDAGIWYSADYVHYSSIDNYLNTPIYANESIGLFPVFSNFYSPNWIIFVDQSNSKGSENPLPGIEARDPYGESELNSNTFAIYWKFVENAIGYKFQLDDNSDFSSPLYDLELESPAFYAPEAIPEGIYYWRVKVLYPNDKESAWSLTFERKSSESGVVLDTETLDIEWQLQRKDTNMLCLFGCNETGIAPWDDEHLPAIKVQPHGINYCSRATISMIASYYGAELSQDRIAYEDYKRKQSVVFEGETISICHYDTCNELGHGMWNDFFMNRLFEKVGIPVGDPLGKQGFDRIKTWIDESRPLALRLEWAGRYDNGHFLVLDGYMIEEKEGETIEKVHLLDPWVGEIWLRYSGLLPYITTTYVTPNYTPSSILKDDEDRDGTPDTKQDSDGDGICDFDENHRFDTLIDVKDTDADGVIDKLDLREYVFDEFGNAFDEDGKRLLSRADWDGDGLRKEVDPDNDDGGAWDGYEDFNFNGIYEQNLRESSNFSFSNERPLGYRRVFFDNFSSDPNTNDQWEIIRLHPEDKINEASWDADNEILYLTRTYTRRGVALFSNYELKSRKWQAFFRYKVGGGSADGFVFNFYKDKESYGLPGCGGSLGFQIAKSPTSCVPITEISGYGIEFDNWGNSVSENINDPSSNHIALIQNSVSNHLTYTNDGRTEDDQWHTVVVKFDYGNVSVILDGQGVLNYMISEPDYSFTGVGFSAGTGSGTNNHIIDDFSLFIYDD